MVALTAALQGPNTTRGKTPPASSTSSKSQLTSKTAASLAKSFSRSQLTYNGSSSSSSSSSLQECATADPEARAKPWKSPKSPGLFRRIFGISASSVLDLKASKSMNNLAQKLNSKPKGIIVSAPISSPSQTHLNVTNPPPPSLPELDIAPNQTSLSLNFDNMFEGNKPSEKLTPTSGSPIDVKIEIIEPPLALPATIVPRSSTTSQTATWVEENNNLSTNREPPILTEDTNNSIPPSNTAELIYKGEFGQIPRHQYAQWLGDEGTTPAIVRNEFMQLFEFSDKNILLAFRCLCERLHMKAESQQLDRVIDSFAHAWVKANPNHGFLNQSIVYTIAYSILLLNTDIHKPDHIAGKSMSRSTFTENTLNTLLELSEYGNSLPSTLPHSNRLSLLLLDDKSLHKDERNIADDADILLHSPGHLSKTEWSYRVKLVLKAFHHSISKDVLYLSEVVEPHNNNNSNNNNNNHSNSNNNNNSLQPLSYASLNPSPSKSNNYIFDTKIDGSLLVPGGTSSPDITKYSLFMDTTTTNRNIVMPDTNTSSSPSKVNRGTTAIIGKLSNLRMRRNTVYENESRLRPSEIQPRTSSVYSRKSMDGSSLAKFNHNNRYSHGLALHNNTISIAESGFVDHEKNNQLEAVKNYEFEEPFFGEGDFDRLERELALENELKLSGPPWIKEGILLYRYSVDPDTGKPSKKKNWKEVSVLIDNGQIKLYQNGGKTAQGHGSSMENTIVLDGFNLCQTLAEIDTHPRVLSSSSLSSSLALSSSSLSSLSSSLSSLSSSSSALASASALSSSTGIGSTWSLTLPHQGVLTFQAPTKDIAAGFVYTSNFWAARLSKEPLTGIVSNADYGWGFSMQNALLTDTTKSPSSSVLSIPSTATTMTGKSGDHVKLKDWDPILQNMVISDLKEKDQLEALKGYVCRIEQSLIDHQKIKTKFSVAFTTGGANWQKANGNWNKKLHYLQCQKMRYSCYINTLEKARLDKEKYISEYHVDNNESERKWFT